MSSENNDKAQRVRALSILDGSQRRHKNQEKKRYVFVIVVVFTLELRKPGRLSTKASGECMYIISLRG